MTSQKISLNALLMYLPLIGKGIYVKKHTFELQTSYRTALAITSGLCRALKVSQK